MIASLNPSMAHYRPLPSLGIANSLHASKFQQIKHQPNPLLASNAAAHIKTRNPNVQTQAFKLQDLIFNGGFNSKTQPVAPPNISFDDVAGIDEAKQELMEVVDFLKNPDRYTQVGATIPCGVLLSGQPGTGKTLLAKAVAGESGVPFFSASGSEFVEMFVGMGASRVRKLFDKAKENAPCIVFIDEIDAMGKSRGGPGSIGGGNDEREQTLNQMLTEMDGFGGNTGVIVIAATNRPDVLDSALLRPGRFDRQIEVPVPDRKGRAEILAVHARGKKISPDVDFAEIAKRTPGFSGADLANLLNEAAITTVRRQATEVTSQDIDNAIDSNIAGAKKVGARFSDEKRALIANHEAGHAIVAAKVKEFDQVQKVSIEPRGKAAGLTWYTPDENRIDSGLYTFAYLRDTIAVALGGRVAEEITLGAEQITTGASNDLQKVTNIARKMVTEFGMSSLGPLVMSTDPMSGQQVSPNTAAKIDEAVTQLVRDGYETARQILTDHRALLDEVATNLLENDSISGDDFRALVAKYDNFRNGI